ncbi:DUF6907 domain-containing protein [Streptomyces rochei]|uniref:DUF6907 domain-containing protein n=1 Tax=Streptomyces rochei TaxID=1928 RepID=UPI00373E97CF
MSTRPRTAPVEVIVAETMNVLEPDWCTGEHHGLHFMADVSHQGPDVPLVFHGQHITEACLTQSPYAEHATRDIQVSVSLTGQSYDATGVYELAAALDTYADRLRDLADQLVAIRSEGAR